MDYLINIANILYLSSYLVRAEFYPEPGPAFTGIPLRCLAYEGMMIEIEAIAMTDGN
jgi:hypothetical protein